MEIKQPTSEELRPQAMSIHTFCWRQGISGATYYKLKKLGRAPAEIRFGNVIRITPEAETAWRAARENPVGAEAEDNARRVAILKARGQRAAKVGITSPNHISARRRAARDKAEVA